MSDWGKRKEKQFNSDRANDETRARWAREEAKKVPTATQAAGHRISRADRTRAYRSLVIGVQELQEAWPRIPEVHGELNDLVGFLFATLPLSEAALAEDEEEG